MRLMVNVHRHPTPGARTMAFHEGPLPCRRVRKGFETKFVTQGHRLLVGENLIARADNTQDVPGVGSDEGFLIGNPHASRLPIAGDGSEDWGFFDWEKPVGS